MSMLETEYRPEYYGSVPDCAYKTRQANTLVKYVLGFLPRGKILIRVKIYLP